MAYKQITVYDKNGRELENFTNTFFSQNTDTVKNKVYTTKVKIVQNGESTLTFSTYKNSEKWQNVKSPENKWHCNGKIYCALSENNYQYSGELVNVTLVEDWYLLAKQYAQIHNTDTSVEALDEHTVKVLPKSPTTNKLTVNGVKYEDSQVKDFNGTLQPRGSAGYALWALIKGNTLGWQIGVCDVIVDGFDASTDFGVFNLESDMKDLLHNIKYVQELWGGILIFDSLNKRIHLRDETKVGTDFNTWKGLEFKEGKNLLSLPVMTQNNDIITKAYILGNGNLNIKAVNDDKGYVENYSYTDSVYTGYLTNANIYYTGNADTSGQTQLLNWGKRELEKICKPRTQYAFEVLDRRFDVGFEHEIFDIHDIVRVVYTNEETGEEETIEKRVIEWEYDYFNEYDSSVVLGDKINNFIEMFNMTYKNSVVDNPKFDYSGFFNGANITIDIPDSLLSFFGGSSSYGLSAATYLYAEKVTENTVAVASVRVYADETFSTIESFTVFQKETADAFSQSYTHINQISDSLSAEIDLRATYDYVNEKTEENSQALANFTAFANQTYAKTSQLASYTTYDAMNNAISTSQASIIAYADKEYASVTISATVNTINSRTAGISNYGGYLHVASDYCKMGYPNAGQYIIYQNGAGDLAAMTLRIQGLNNLSLTSPNLYIMGHRVTWSAGGYLIKA